jgi:hypothetical protein
MKKFGIQIFTGKPEVSGFLLPKAFFPKKFFLQFKMEVILFGSRVFIRSGALNSVELSQQKLNFMVNIPKLMNVPIFQRGFRSFQFPTRCNWLPK